MKPRVLVVDDDPSIRYTVETILAEADLPVHAVASGHECLDQLATGFRGLILLDIMMPDMDGYRTIREIVERGWCGDNVVCMLTAVMESDLKVPEVSNMVHGYVRKPFQPDDLIHAVRRHLTHFGQSSGTEWA